MATARPRCTRRAARRPSVCSSRVLSFLSLFVASSPFSRLAVFLVCFSFSRVDAHSLPASRCVIPPALPSVDTVRPTSEETVKPSGSSLRLCRFTSSSCDALFPSSASLLSSPNALCHLSLPAAPPAKASVVSSPFTSSVSLALSRKYFFPVRKLSGSFWRGTGSGRDAKGARGVLRVPQREAQADALEDGLKKGSSLHQAPAHSNPIRPHRQANAPLSEERVWTGTARAPLGFFLPQKATPPQAVPPTHCAVTSCTYTSARTSRLPAPELFAATVPRSASETHTNVDFLPLFRGKTSFLRRLASYDHRHHSAACSSFFSSVARGCQRRRRLGDREVPDTALLGDGRSLKMHGRERGEAKSETEKTSSLSLEFQIAPETVRARDREQEHRRNQWILHQSEEEWTGLAAPSMARGKRRGLGSVEMKVRKGNEIRELSTPEIEREVLLTRQEIARLELLKRAYSTEYKPHLLKEARHYLAQLLTIRYERHLGLHKDIDPWQQGLLLPVDKTLQRVETSGAPQPARSPDSSSSRPDSGSDKKRNPSSSLASASSVASDSRRLAAPSALSSSSNSSAPASKKHLSLSASEEPFTSSSASSSAPSSSSLSASPAEGDRSSSDGLSAKKESHSKLRSVSSSQQEVGREISRQERREARGSETADGGAKQRPDKTTPEGKKSKKHPEESIRSLEQPKAEWASKEKRGVQSRVEKSSENAENTDTDEEVAISKPKSSSRSSSSSLSSSPATASRLPGSDRSSWKKQAEGEQRAEAHEEKHGREQVSKKTGKEERTRAEASTAQHEKRDSKTRKDTGKETRKDVGKEKGKSQKAKTSETETKHEKFESTHGSARPGEKTAIRLEVSSVQSREATSAGLTKKSGKPRA
ncbi:ribosomal protein RPL29 [Toxoplasma gondii MAS]|uniref:Ribosomal protein RPL29 n=1 Tax=Toxoplasma gondii MAS TaxID=943118 RepID=A0A086PKS8_TOXGO|nr:ribosomal protein RPL29 [Toxoplasma gondii MAS]